MRSYFVQEGPHSTACVHLLENHLQSWSFLCVAPEINWSSRSKVFHGQPSFIFAFGMWWAEHGNPRQDTVYDLHIESGNDGCQELNLHKSFNVRFFLWFLQGTLDSGSWNRLHGYLIVDVHLYSVVGASPLPCFSWNHVHPRPYCCY